MAGPLPLVVLAQRYAQDPTFHALVDHLVAVLQRRDVSPRYIWEAVLLAEAHMAGDHPSVLLRSAQDDTI